jgi:hypothetical protein
LLVGEERKMEKMFLVCERGREERGGICRRKETSLLSFVSETKEST